MIGEGAIAALLEPELACHRADGAHQAGDLLVEAAGGEVGP